MDTFTFYLDTEDPRQIGGMPRALWIAMICWFGINSLWHGWRLLSHIPGSTDWIASIIQVFCGVGIITAGIIEFYLRKKYGRRYVMFSYEGLEIKTKRRGHPEKISWDEIQAMHLKINGVEIVPKAQPTDPIEIPAGTCSYTQFQQIKKNLKENSAKYHVESNF